jgi:hypothetical protein
MSSIFLISFVVSGIIGLKKPILGVISGCVLTIILFFILYEFERMKFIIVLVFGCLVSFAGGYFIPWFFSGFKGGKHNTGPSFIGGGSGKGWGEHTGGIILSDEERKNIKKGK